MYTREANTVPPKIQPSLRKLNVTVPATIPRLDSSFQGTIIFKGTATEASKQIK